MTIVCEHTITCPGACRPVQHGRPVPKTHPRMHTLDPSQGRGRPRGAVGCHLRSQGPPGLARGDTPLVKARVTSLRSGAGGLAVSVGDGGPQEGRAGQHLPHQTQVGIMMVKAAGLSTGRGADSPAAPRVREEVATGKGSLGAESELTSPSPPAWPWGGWATPTASQPRNIAQMSPRLCPSTSRHHTDKIHIMHVVQGLL